MEDAVIWPFRSPSPEEFKRAMAELAESRP